MSNDKLEKLTAQLKTARDEISNLRFELLENNEELQKFPQFDDKFFRSQINSLNHVHRKEVEAIKSTLADFKCGKCCQCAESRKVEENAKKEVDQSFVVKPIGYIKSVFADKRAVPRQANIAETILSRIELRKDLYTNPEQCLDTLDEFSHFWIIFHFHKNDPHSKPKVCPPRLDGKKVGVLATRSPHRPNPIGISLVKLDRIEGSTIYFYGSDMVDSTPVIDIKPYIPSYDSPQNINDSQTVAAFRSREEPEGEEEHVEDAAVAASPSATAHVKVPTWVSDSNLLKVIFSENALQQIQELRVNKKSIQEILENDPRSVYVREKYLSQIYNFQVDGNQVICKFDDKQATVTVLQVRKLPNMNE